MIILSRKFQDIEVLNSSIGMSGEFRLVVRNSSGDIVRDTGFFPNIILNAGLNKIGNSTGVSGCAIGTGTATPLAANLALNSQSQWTTLAVSLVTPGSGAVAPYWGGSTYTYRFPIGSLNGNYSEVGVGWDTGPNMFSHALILDGVGAPTTITVGLTEQLDVTYQFRCYTPAADTTNTVTIGGVSTVVTTRGALAGNGYYWGNLGLNFGNYKLNADGYLYAGPMGAVTDVPTGAGDYDTGGFGADPYVNNSLTRSIYYNYTTANANFAGGIRSSKISFGMATFQCEFSPLIPKTNLKTLVMTYACSWSRRP